MNKLKTAVKKPKGIVLIAIVALALGLALPVSYIFVVSPAAIRSPALEHAHLRMQLVVDNQTVNFGDDKFQETYQKGVCNADLPEAPIHFHDNKDQFVHLHWKDITGGLVLKNYGWDFTGGPNELLGYRLDELPKIKAVPIYGNVLPELSRDTKLWVFTGNAGSYEERLQKDFINQDLETFFGKKSTINAEEVSLLDRIFPRAYAHSGSYEAESTDDSTSQEQLERINNLLGDVVIFAQNDRPTDQQINERFNHLEPLTESTCGG